MTGANLLPGSPSLANSVIAQREAGTIEHGMFLPFVDALALAIGAGLATGLTAAFETYAMHTPRFDAVATTINNRHAVFFALCLVQLAMFWSKGLYSGRTPWWSQVQYIGKVALILLFLDGFFSFALKLHEPRLLIGTSWLFVFGSTIGLRWTACRFAASRGWTTMPTAIIADSATATDLIYAFHADPCAGYDVKTVLLRDYGEAAFNQADLPRGCRKIRVRDGLNAYEDYIRRHPDYFYAIALHSFQSETRDSLLKTLDDLKVSYGIVPAVSGAGAYDMEARYFFGHDVMLLQPRARNAAARTLSLTVKRALDIAVSGLVLTVLALPLALVALALKLEGQGGSCFYGGERVGKDGRAFRCWKFRSMEPDSDHMLHAYLDANPGARDDWDKYRKLPRDPRVTTWTARFIRKASIDELPQLWNVLVGDMTLVGPRPILHDEISYFGDAIKEYESVRPGLTGLWQVSGRNATSFLRRVYWDRWYVRNWSLWGDIVILIKTPIVLLTRQGAS